MFTCLGIVPPMSYLRSSSYSYGKQKLLWERCQLVCRKELLWGRRHHFCTHSWEGHRSDDADQGSFESQPKSSPSQTRLKQVKSPRNSSRRSPFEKSEMPNFIDDNLPLQHSLRLNCDLQSDFFIFQTTVDVKPFTRRDVFSVIISLFDPLGFVAPITIQGKFFLWEFLSESTASDEPLPDGRLSDWLFWRESLHVAQEQHIPRTFYSFYCRKAIEKEINIFSGASEKAIAAVAYEKFADQHGSNELGFVLRKSKVTLLHGHTITRLELCGAVLAVQIAEIIEDNLGISKDCQAFLHWQQGLPWVYQQHIKEGLRVCS